MYNTCKHCGANNGRAGNLINGKCMNCHDTETTENVVIHMQLPRTDEEIAKTMELLENKEAMDLCHI